MQRRLVIEQIANSDCINFKLHIEQLSFFDMLKTIPNHPTTRQFDYNYYLLQLGEPQAQWDYTPLQQIFL